MADPCRCRVSAVLAGLAAALAALAVRARRRAAGRAGDTGPGDGQIAGPPSPDAVTTEITEITAAGFHAGRPQGGSQP
jgi:hypothetical protein